jgi:predicted DNA-binding protein
MGMAELHRKDAESHPARYSMRLRESTKDKIDALSKAGWDMPNFIRNAVEEAVDEAYAEKIGNGGRAA